MFIPNFNPEDDVSLEVRREIEYNDKLRQAKGLFRLESEYNEIINKTNYNTENWTLRDYVAEADWIAEQYKFIAMNIFNLSLQDLQSIKSNEVDKDVFKIVKCWRIWQRFVISFRYYLTDDIKCVEEHMSKYDLL